MTKFKKFLIKYRSIAVIAGGLLFNLAESLLVWHPEGVVFNKTPMTVTEYICDIMSAVWVLFGFLMLLYDSNKDNKEKMEAAFKTGADELRKVGVKFEVK